VSVNSGFVLATIVAGSLFVPRSGLSVSNTWRGSANRDWSSAANWSLNHVPLPGEDVLVDATAATDVLLAESTAALASFTITNQSLHFANWNTQLKAGKVMIRNGGVLTIAGPFTDIQMSNRIYVACSDLTIKAGGRIDVDAMGFAGSPAAPHSSGPGKATGGDGAGHGGRGGGAVNACNGRGQPAGSPEAPIHPGSSGYVYSIGGGAVRIAAEGRVLVNGTITANGRHDDTADVYSHGGGSGGSIYITCRTFDGSTNGLLRANGSAGALYYGGGGGGGRIAVVFDTNAQDSVPAPGVRFATRPGGPSTYGAFGGDAGTVYFPDADLLPVGSGLFDSGLFNQCRVYIPSLTSWSPLSVTVTDCDFSFAHSNLQLHIANGLTVGRGGGFGIGPGSELVCGADLTVYGGGKLYVYAGTANASGHGALVDVTGDVLVGYGSWIYPYSDSLSGGSALFRANNVTLMAGGGIDADHKGFLHRHGPGAGADGVYGGGGGHGGHGGHGYAASSLGGRRHGSVRNPLSPGSGGGYPNNMGDGGGLVRLETRGAVNVLGTITANGRPAGHYVGGGGAGGGINIECETFEGASSGLLRVSGGNGAYYSGGGGGGRIAVRYNPTAQRSIPPPGVNFQATPGAKGELLMDPPAQMGTVYFPDTALLPLASETFTGNLFRDVMLHVDGFASWSPASLTVQDCDFVLARTGFSLNVSGNVQIGNGGGFGLSSNSILSCSGNLRLNNGGTLTLFSGATHATRDYGSLVDISGSMSIGSNSWVYPYSQPADGGSVLFRVGSLSISTNGGINADHRGFGGGQGPGLGSAVGYGAGSGYGGQGGPDAVANEGGPIYGSSNAPTLPGSGGDTAQYEVRGGGLVHVEANGHVAVHGTATANGQQGSLYTGGAGSGGGIFITCRSFESSTNGLLRADGGPAGHYGGAGGGGRIALWYETTAGDLPRMSVTGGLTRPGANGTIHLRPLPPAGTLIMVRWPDEPPADLRVEGANRRGETTTDANPANPR